MKTQEITEKIQSHLESLPSKIQEELATALEETLARFPFPERLYPEKENYSAEDLEAILAQFPADKKWTYEDLMDERIFPPHKQRLFLFQNQIFIMKPTLTHQEIATNFATFLNLFVLTNKLGKVYTPPLNVKLSEDTTLEPDVVYLSVSKLEMTKNDKAILGAPDLVLEVISPANYPKLREAKKETYAEFGIQEYWEIHPKSRKISVHTLEENEEKEKNEYVLFSEAVEKGRVKSKVLQGFEVEVENILPEEATEKP